MEYYQVYIMETHSPHPESTHRIVVVPLHMVLNKEWQMQVLACAHA